MNLQTLSPHQEQKRTIVRSVQYGYVPADQNGGTSKLSLTMTLKLECTGLTPDAFYAIVLQQLLHQ